MLTEDLGPPGWGGNEQLWEFEMARGLRQHLPWDGLLTHSLSQRSCRIASQPSTGTPSPLGSTQGSPTLRRAALRGLSPNLR